MHEVHPQTFKQISGYQLLLAIHPPNAWFLLFLLRSKFWIAGTYPFGDQVFGKTLWAKWCIFSVLHWFGVTCMSHLMVTEKLGRILQKDKLSWRDIKITANRFCWLWSCSFKMKKIHPWKLKWKPEMEVWKMILPFRDVFQVVRFRGRSPNEFTTFLSAQFGFFVWGENRSVADGLCLVSGFDLGLTGCLNDVWNFF